MEMPKRHGSSDSYRFGFNGMEKDDETYAESGTAYDFGARVYSSRLGRFLSTDRYEKDFADQAPYLISGNNPIVYIDKNGDFKISKTTADAYPNLKPALAKLRHKLINNQKLAMDLAKLGEFKDHFELIQTLSDGFGPELKVENITDLYTKVSYNEDGIKTTEYVAEISEKGKELGNPDPSAAFTDTKGKLVDGKATELEQTVYLDDAVAEMTKKMYNKKGNSNEQFLAIFENLIIHELGHVGDQRDGKSNSTEGAGDEVGDAAEEKFSGTNKNNVKTLIKHEPKNKN